MEYVTEAPGAPPAVGAYALATISRGIVHVSGQIAFNEAGKFMGGSAAEQTTRIMGNVGAILAACGCGIRDIVNTRIDFTNMDDFRSIDTAYQLPFLQEALVTGDDPDKVKFPSRTSVIAKSLPILGALVEITVTAHQPETD